MNQNCEKPEECTGIEGTIGSPDNFINSIGENLTSNNGLIAPLIVAIGIGLILKGK